MAKPKEIIQVGQLELRFLLDAEDTGNQMLLFESVFPAGSKVAAPPHYHQYVDEIIYGLEGTLTVTLDGKRIEIGPGQSCFIPKGIVHHLQNNTAQTVKTLGLTTPALIGPSYFREISEFFKPGVLPDPNKVRETMLRYDTVPVMPGHDQKVAVSTQITGII
jgi:quercetin dioxygenase-like cupin family protein